MISEENEAKEPIKYEMTAAEAGLFADLDRAALEVNAQDMGACSLIIRQRGFQGMWSRRGNVLIRQS